MDVGIRGAGPNRADKLRQVSGFKPNCRTSSSHIGSSERTADGGRGLRACLGPCRAITKVRAEPDDYGTVYGGRCEMDVRLRNYAFESILRKNPIDGAFVFIDPRLKRCGPGR